MPAANPVAVIDSNVLVSGLLTSRADAPTAVLLDLMLAGRMRFALSMELLSEYHRVLRYAKIARLHGLRSEQIDDLLTQLATPAIIREPEPVSVTLSDPADRFLFDLLASFDNGVLVTGDKAVLEEAPDWASVVSPAGFTRNIGRW